MEKEPGHTPDEPSGSSSKEVLGSDFGKSNVDPRWEWHYAALTKMRNALLNRRDDLMSQAAEEVTSPQRNIADQGTNEYDRDLVLSMASAEQDVLYEIEQALNRIKNRTYGICEATGRPIEPDRLKAIPWTRFSLEAEQRMEAEGQVRRAHLGDLEPIPRHDTESGR